MALIRIVPCISSRSLFIPEQHFIAGIFCPLFTHSPANGHLGCFPWGLLWIQLPWSFLFTSFCAFISLVPYVGVELLCQGTDICIIFFKTSKELIKGVVPFYTPASSVWECLLLHILVLSALDIDASLLLNIGRTEHSAPPPHHQQQSFLFFCRSRKDGVWEETAWIWSSALLLTSYGHLDKLLHFSVSLFLL